MFKLLAKTTFIVYYKKKLVPLSSLSDIFIFSLKCQCQPNIGLFLGRCSLQSAISIQNREELFTALPTTEKQVQEK